MESILSGSIYGNEEIIKTYTENFRLQNLSEDVEVVNVNGISGTSTSIQLDGLFIEIRSVTTSHDYEVHVAHDFPFFKLHFEIEGSNHYIPDNDNSIEILIQDGQYNFFYFPQVTGMLYFKAKKRKTLEIQFTEDYFERVIGDNFKELFAKLGNAISAKKPFILWEKSRSISFELKSSIKDIIECSYKGNIKKAYLEAKVLELLIVLLATSAKEIVEPKRSTISLAEHEQLIYVERYIQENYNRTITISQLALIAGLNTSKLKQDFKAMYSTTIFKYITDLRMEKAKQNLIDGRGNITEISFEVGYKNPQHFTVAFKKKFGILPKDIQNKGVI
ncbi:AraC family transcriptional regulator [uncultured Cytophaga sp.]|uniref:helix-turn-helix transcriptional regulator n=1 Tax=uncultured Cytophaga sp. TaxID=160238 RepID=UPI00262ED176|nr:AraC family transcriptional regulator [uncultured Cytophaga sp.]